MIEVAGLTKRYGDTIAVDGLSFEVHPGRVTGFLGPNGAGKSTTMRMILGLDAPSAGRAFVGGRAYRDLHRPLLSVGAVLEADAFHPARSARSHLRVAARSNGIGLRRVAEVLDQVGLAAVASRRVRTYSLGMRQRLAIAAALLGDPAIVMLDEPVNGLDADGVRWVRHLLQDLAAEGRTVLVSSHLLSEMQQTADHLLVIGRGRLIADAPTADVLAGSGHREVRVRAEDPEALAAVLRRAGADIEPTNAGDLRVSGLSTTEIAKAALGASLVVLELAESSASLEEAYLELTSGEADHLSGQAPPPS